MNINTLTFIALFLCLSLSGCTKPPGAEKMMQREIAVKNQIADLMSEGASEAEIQTLQNSLDVLEDELAAKKLSMSKVKWNRLVVKYREKSDAASERLLNATDGQRNEMQDAAREK